MRSDRRDQRTVNGVAFAVREGGPSAKRLGLLVVRGRPKEGAYDAGNQEKDKVEGGGDGRAHVERAAAAAAFEVRSHAHGDACACGGRTGSPIGYDCGREARRFFACCSMQGAHRPLRMAAVRLSCPPSSQ